MCRKKVDTPWSIYRDFTVTLLYLEAGGLAEGGGHVGDLVVGEGEDF